MSESLSGTDGARTDGRVCAVVCSLRDEPRTPPPSEPNPSWQHILTAKHGQRIAVIENEFGEVGIDDQLLQDKFNTDEDIFEVNNGCICCTVRVDLITILDKLSKRHNDPNNKLKLDHIVIETTGLADPAPVAQTFFVDENVKAFARLDGIVTLIDAYHIEQHLDEVKPEGTENEAVEQALVCVQLVWSASRSLTIGSGVRTW